MTFRLLIVALALALAGCADIPADPEGTLERVRQEGSFKVGIIAPGATAVAEERQRRFLQHVAGTTGASPVMTTGAMEPLLLKLEEGDLDLVIGPVAPKSPWSTRVTLLPPLYEHVAEGEHHILAAAARNGENDWIGVLHPAASAVRTGR